jgi:hypothetical protein
MKPGKAKRRYVLKPIPSCVSRSKFHRKSLGRVYSGVTLFSFRAEARVLVAEPIEQATLARLRTLRAQRYSDARCANELNVNGVASKLRGQWHAFTVSKVLAAGA